jgi:hypothetical protein
MRFWGWGSLEAPRVAPVRARLHGHGGAQADIAGTVHDATDLSEERSHTWPLIPPSRSIFAGEGGAEHHLHRARPEEVVRTGDG